MTLLDVRNQVVSTFCEHDTFSRDNFPGIKLESRFEDKRDELIRAALSQLVVIGLVAKVGDDLWMLTNPLNMAGQDVHVSMEIGNEIAGTINAWIKGSELDEIPPADPLNLHEGHIIMLLSIISDLLNDDDSSFDPRGEGLSD